MPKQLPSQANLDHFKKQAKRLLKAGRDAAPEAIARFANHHPSYANRKKAPLQAKLHEAQLVVAREHDFPSWPALVAAVADERSRQEPNASGILILTNGLAAVEALTRANISGQKEEWIEVLHDGPVPLTANRSELNRIRAQHIASLGWSSEEAAFNRFEKRDRLLTRPGKHQTLHLYFEHDLYDQLQLVQILDTLADHPDWIAQTQLFQSDRFLTELNPDELVELSQKPIQITAAHAEIARKTWDAFRNPDPDSLAKRLAASDLTALPQLKPAMKRLIEEFPAKDSRLGRTERQILNSVTAGAQTPITIFKQSQAMEEAAYMGDLSFFQIVDRLTRGEPPLLSVENATHLFADANPLKFETFKKRRIQTTDTATALLAGQHSHRTTPYWIGGTQITPN